MISYSGLTNYGKASLPSVSSWGANNNILKDPPRSITTYRKDKVGDNSFIIQEIDCSSDRAAEAILAFPRGINPMVKVSYTDFTGGVGKGQALLYRGRQGKLPYRVADHGAFRPPILAPVDLLPFSRMPRNITKIDPIIFNPDYSKKITCEAEKRATKEKINSSFEGMKKFIPNGHQKSFYTSPIIKDSLKGEIYLSKVGPAKYIDPENTKLNRSPKNAPRYSINGTVKYNPFKMQKEKYTAPSIKKSLQGTVQSNISGNQIFFQNSRQITSTRDSTLKYSNLGTKKFIPGKEQRTKHVDPMIKNVLHSSATSAISKNYSGGTVSEDLRGPSKVVTERRGAIIIPDGINRGRIASNVRGEMNVVLQNRRLVPMAR